MARAFEGDQAKPLVPKHVLAIRYCHNADAGGVQQHDSSERDRQNAKVL